MQKKKKKKERKKEKKKKKKEGQKCSALVKDHQQITATNAYGFCLLSIYLPRPSVPPLCK